MIEKQPIDISFAQGLDTKTDPWRVPAGKFLKLENSVFTKGGLLQKRNGYEKISSLFDSSYKFITTLNDNLTVLGPKVASFNEGSNSWIQKGSLAPIGLQTLPLIRNSINQVQADSAIASNGSICVAYTEVNSGTFSYKYAIADSITGQNIISPTAIPVSVGTVTGSPRVFLVSNYFVIVFTTTISGVIHLQYVAISVESPTVVTTAQDIASPYVPASTLAFDGISFNNTLYIAWNTITGGQSIKVAMLNTPQIAQGQAASTAYTFVGAKATMMSWAIDTTNVNPVFYLGWFDGVNTVSVASLFSNCAVNFAPQVVETPVSVANITLAAQNNACSIFYEIINNYSYDSAVPTHYIRGSSVTSAGVVGTKYNVVRSVGLASKAFIYDGNAYFLAAYQSNYQPTYFMINGSTSTQSSPVVVAKLAYSNGGGYLPYGLPSVTITDSLVNIPYLYKDFIAAASTSNATPVAGQTLGVYNQTGINLSTFNFNGFSSAVSIASNLQISGGFLWNYDGYLPVEQNFFVWPDNVEVSASGTAGGLTAQPYFYVATYEWSDNQGNIYRSANSIPVKIDLTATATTAVTVNVPYLRLTYKIANPVKIVIYRWSQNQQVFYQVTSLTQAQINTTTADSLTYVDTASDASILGNTILYTTGGVLENVNPPATNIMTLFDTRLWLVDAEDPNLLWYSKQVIESTPVEMSDLLTFYIPPTVGSQGSTGPIKALAPMDDKLIIFKNNAIYYINGTGPDNTGANNQYSQPIFITSTVGCSNQQSIVFIPQGLMFQSNKGIWLLGRDLTTSYIGAPVEQFNTSTVLSAVNVPQTNQVRLTLSTGQTLMYDYFYQQWGTFVNVPAVSSCIYQGLHTFINSSGVVYQEKPGSYLDDTTPVLLSFKTGWINLAGLQGYQRAFFFYLLGKYYSPHKLLLNIAYDYTPSPSQSTVITPNNYSAAYGGNGADDQNPYGQQEVYGGPSDVEQWRVFLSQQRCQAFQIELNEIYDASFGVSAGAGLTLSGINCIVGIKSGFTTIAARNSTGTS